MLLPGKLCLLPSKVKKPGERPQAPLTENAFRPPTGSGPAQTWQATSGDIIFQGKPLEPLEPGPLGAEKKEAGGVIPRLNDVSQHDRTV